MRSLILFRRACDRDEKKKTFRTILCLFCYLRVDIFYVKCLLQKKNFIGFKFQRRF